jgi:hypothetical protein
MQLNAGALEQHQGHAVCHDVAFVVVRTASVHPTPVEGA